MDERAIYYGYALQGVDEKSRVAIPSSMRASLDANARDGAKDRVFVLTTHEAEPCLIGFDEAYLPLRLAAMAERERQFVRPDGTPDFGIKRKGMGALDKLGYDASGRFVLPGFAKFRARLGAHAFFYGSGDYFEIWDPKTLIDCPTADEVQKEAARYFMAEKGIAL